MRVVLTGGAGFIGQALAQELVAAGHEVIAVDALLSQVHRNPERSVQRFPGRVVIGDVRDPSALAAGLRGSDVVVHLAAETGVAQSMYEAARYRSVNFEGTRLVAADVRRSGQAFVFVSSRAVYGQGAYKCPDHGRTDTGRCCGRGQPDASRETDACLPVSVYGATKLQAERTVLDLFDGEERAVIVRPQNVLGTGQAPHNPYTGVLAAFAARLGAGLAPQVFDPGTQTRDFVDIRDAAVTLHWLATEVGRAQQSTCRVFNMGSGRRTSVLDLARLAADAAGEPGREPELVEITRPGDVEHACADLRELTAARAPTPRVPLQSSVTSFLEDVFGQELVDPALWDRALDELERSQTR
jgi:dTDP-L-rhamnose 4-epimerase